MSDIRNWSATDASNTATPPDGFPEGMQAGKLNDSGRAVMGAVRRFAEDVPWFDFGDTITRSSSSSFNASGSGTLADRYYTNRRVKLTGTLTGTIYGTISGTSGSFLVTVTLDSGTIQADSDLKAYVGLPADNPALATAGVSGLTALLDALIPVGTVYDYAGSSAPSKFVFCDGAAISRTTYADLFAAIGTTFGAGDGSTTFAVPDLRGRTVAGKDDMGGAAGGVQEHTLVTSEMPAHTHSIGNQGSASHDGSGNPSAVSGAGTSGSTGGDGAHTNLQPTIVLNKIIYTGVA